MFKNLYFIGLLGFICSCSSQKKVQKVAVQPINSEKTALQQVSKPHIQHIGANDFYKVNIGNPAKNDNTISHGSIVSASPKGYKVTKNYFPSVGQNFRQRFVIVHYTALDNDKSLRVLTEQSVSSHYLVNDTDDNEIYQLVDENKRAYHAGASAWRNFENLNDTSIGIEIVGKGYTADALGKKTFYEYPEYQFKKVAALIKDLVERYQIQPIYVLAHSDIAPTRKEDPGPKFPWKRLYQEYGVGMWYDDATKIMYLNQINPELFESQKNTSDFIGKLQLALKDFGYKITITRMMDKATIKTIEAFQYHFRPELYDGMIDAETWAILQALLQKYPTK